MEFKCPYCPNHQYVDPDFLKWEVGDEKLVECKNCEHKFLVRGYETVTYYTVVVME